MEDCAAISAQAGMQVSALPECCLQLLKTHAGCMQQLLP
jgi:hypothetical protein